MIPGIDGLTEHCRTEVRSLGKSHATAWAALIQQCNQEGLAANIENVLSKVRTKIEAVGQAETLVGLTRKQLQDVESKICAAIARKASPADTKIPNRMPHNDFADWVKNVTRTAPIEIFTTNYDVLFERAFEATRVPVFDGFVGTHRPFFYPECLHDDEQLPTTRWIRLWKLHGSVNWLLDDQPEGKRIVRSHLTESGELILPSHRKYDESRKQPYLAYMDRLSHILNSEHALLVTCGYSFRDEHINDILYGALDTRNTANIIALQFMNLNENDDVSASAAKRSNLSVIAPNGGVISGIAGLWQLTQPVDNKTSSFMDIAFDSAALAEDKGSPAAVAADLTGRMRLGDFHWFCRFPQRYGSKHSMTQSTSTLVGHVDSVKGGLVTIRLRPREDVPTFMLVDGRSYRVGQVGAFLRIPLGYTHLYAVCTLVGAAAAPRTDGSPHPPEHRWLAATLFGESIGGVFERGVSQYPTIEDEVHLVTPKTCVSYTVLRNKNARLPSAILLRPLNFGKPRSRPACHTTFCCSGFNGLRQVEFRSGVDGGHRHAGFSGFACSHY